MRADREPMRGWTLTRRPPGRRPDKRARHRTRRSWPNPIRRQFTAEYRLRIIEEAERCTRPGEVGRLLRLEGLYASHLSAWRKARRNGSLRGLTAKLARTHDLGPLRAPARHLSPPPCASRAQCVPLGSKAIVRGAGCPNWACPDLWEPRVGNCLRPPGQSICRCGRGPRILAWAVIGR